MRELPEPKITPVLLDEFKQALAGGRGGLDAWLEVNDEAEVRAFVLAIQKQAYEDGMRDAKQFFDNNSDAMFWGSQASGHIRDLLTASQKKPQ